MTEVMWQNGRYYPANASSSNNKSDTDYHKVDKNTLILK